VTAPPQTKTPGGSSAQAAAPAVMWNSAVNAAWLGTCQTALCADVMQSQGPMRCRIVSGAGPILEPPVASKRGAATTVLEREVIRVEDNGFRIEDYHGLGEKNQIEKQAFFDQEVQDGPPSISYEYGLPLRSSLQMQVAALCF